MIPALRSSTNYAEDSSMDSASLNRVLFEYLSQQATKQVTKEVQHSDSDLSNMSKISACSLTGISPPASLLGNLLEQPSLGLSTGLPSPTNTLEANFAKLSDQSLRSCCSPVHDRLFEGLNSASMSPPRHHSTGDLSDTHVPAEPLHQPLPTTLLVSPATHPQQAASLINLSLTQPGANSFLLAAHLGDPATPGAQGGLCAALRAAITARKMHNATGPHTDLAMLPVFTFDAPSNNNGGPRGASDQLNLHVYHVAAGLLPLGTHVKQLRVDLSSHPMMLTLQLAQEVVCGGSGAVQAVEVVFGPAAARLALTVLTNVHSHLQVLGHEAVLLPHGLEGGPSTSQFSVLVVPTALGAQAMAQAVREAHQILAAGSVCSALYPGADLHGLGLPRTSSSGMVGYDFHNGYPALGGGSPGPASRLQSTLSLPPALQGLSGPFPVEATPEAAQAGDFQRRSQRYTLAAAVEAVGTKQLQPAARSPLTDASSPPGSNPGSRSRSRKADWVIVTEDTAIKNAAGAIAKVVGRLHLQGMCCPVYMERKTARYTGVVSVAVKAIAVARGYVHNEATGHEVGFQPYFRGDVSACAYGAARPPGAPALGPADSARSDTLDSQLALDLLLMAGGSPAAGLSPRGSVQGLRGDSPACRGGSPPPLLGGSPRGSVRGDGREVAGGSGASSYCGDDDNTVAWGELEQAELAFDVYKINLDKEPSEGSSLPIKVTAHSRPGVVSSIINKLIMERESAVLVTAGGRAMHVAMLAVVTARQRLQARGIDILLLPKFVTVDTTQTLGWESVFLRFIIVRWSPAQAVAASVSHKLAAVGLPNNAPL